MLLCLGLSCIYIGLNININLNGVEKGRVCTLFCDDQLYILCLYRVYLVYIIIYDVIIYSAISSEI